MRKKILALLKTGKSQEYIINVLAANTEVIEDDLLDLLNNGYNKVRWILMEPHCPKCKDLENQEWTLEEFLSGLEHHAPIFEHSHPNCDCQIEVSGGDDGVKVFDWSGQVY